MPICPTCAERNPAVPVYSKAVPTVTVGCQSCGQSFFIPNANVSSGGKSAEVIAGDQISVLDTSDSIVDRFTVSFSPHQAMTVVLSLIAKVATVPQGAIVLFGITIDEINLSWVYSKPSEVVSQSITNDGGLSVPTLLLPDIAYNYTAQSIQADVDFTITGNDGQGKPDSIAIAIAGVVFGNYRVWGHGPTKDGGSFTPAQLITFIEGLIGGLGNKEISTTRVKASLQASGGSNEHFFYAFPKSWGFATFTQNGIPGGLKRLGSVGGVILSVPLQSYDVGEVDVLVDNGTAAEAYHIYESAADNINGALFAVI